MSSLIAPATLDFLLEQGSALALIDVREHGEYNAAHIPGASSLPRRLLEYRLPRLVPCPSVQVVLYDDDGRRAGLAARTVEQMGYERLALLDGGLNGWASSGRPTEWGMNVPSKDFGERVEVEHQVPTIEPAQLQSWIQAGEPVVILDTRTPEEYRQYCIPGGRNVPGGELALRTRELLREQPEARLVVNCAGRTRSIIGARILQRMGLPNVVSLKNGTSGWVLAGLELESGADRLELPQPGEEGLARAEAIANRLAAQDGVRYLSVPQLKEVLDQRATDCTYLVDVRTKSEFVAGHVPGFWWCPGGQAVQRADDLVAVRKSTTVFCCDGLVRATVTASWFRQMGFPNVFAVQGGTTTWATAGLPLERGSVDQPPFGLAEAAARTRHVSPTELRHLLQGADKPVVLFVDTSREFAAGHVPGALWLSRSWLELHIGSLVPELKTPVVLTDSQGLNAPLAATALAERGYSDVSALEGGMAAWRADGLPLEQGLAGVMRPPDDVVPAGPERSYADMVNYLRWEEALGHKYEPRGSTAASF